ncbi:hypothetical protein AOLI_G00041310 [Acnodon oligacanthus]
MTSVQRLLQNKEMTSVPTAHRAKHLSAQVQTLNEEENGSKGIRTTERNHSSALHDVHQCPDGPPPAATAQLHTLLIFSLSFSSTDPPLPHSLSASAVSMLSVLCSGAGSD